MMNKEFLKLIENFTSHELSGKLLDDEQLNNEVEKLDEVFNPSGDMKFKLKSTKVCPIATSGENFKYVVIGLNPHDDGDIDEKNDITTWKELAEFHTPIDLHGNNIFKRVMSDKVSRYYQNLTVLFQSLEKRELVEWKKDFKQNLSKEDVRNKFLKMIEENPIAVAELIPFASEKFGVISQSKLKRLFNSDSRFKDYIVDLINLILSRTLSDGWIICNGRNACDTFKLVLEILHSDHDFKLCLNREKEKYAVYNLDGKKVLLLYNSVMNRGELESYAKIKNMIEDVTSIC